MRTNVAIIGAGISGLSAANLLQENGLTAEVFESNTFAGGLVACTNEDGNLFHRVGGHVFNTKDPAVHEWFWRKFDKSKEFIKATRKAAIYLDKSFIGYPIELNLGSLPIETATNVIEELIAISAKSQSGKDAKKQTFRDFLINNFGHTLCELYFMKYNSKIWNRDLNEFPLDWLEGKLPMVTPNEIIVKNIVNSPDEMVHSFFYYPINGGSQFIVDRLKDPIKVVYQKVSTISKTSLGYHINNNEDHSYDYIIYTGSIRELPALIDNKIKAQLELGNNRLNDLDSLDFNGTSNLLCECDENEYSWIYLPELETKCHRIIMTGNFSCNNNSKSLPRNRTTCTVEVSGLCSREEMEREITKLPFNLRSIAYNYCDKSYIIHNRQTESVVNSLTSFFESKDIYCCGRFAEWRYYNMDAAISSAMKVTSKILNRSGLS